MTRSLTVFLHSPAPIPMRLTTSPVATTGVEIVKAAGAEASSSGPAGLNLPHEANQQGHHSSVVSHHQTVARVCPWRHLHVLARSCRCCAADNWRRTMPRHMRACSWFVRAMWKDDQRQGNKTCLARCRWRCPPGRRCPFAICKLQGSPSPSTSLMCSIVVVFYQNHRFCLLASFHTRCSARGLSDW